MTRDEVGQLPARMSLYWQAVPDEERSQALVDFGQGWLVPARLVRKELLAAYDHWAEEQAREEARRHAPDDGVAYEETEF